MVTISYNYLGNVSARCRISIVVINMFLRMSVATFPKRVVPVPILMLCIMMLALVTVVAITIIMAARLLPMLTTFIFAVFMLMTGRSISNIIIVLIITFMAILAGLSSRNA